MVGMDEKDVEKLAQLARIEVSEGEKEALSKDMDSILEFVGQINGAKVEIDTEGRVGAVVNAMREDGEPHESGKYTKALLDEAPEQDRGYVKVKKIL